MLTQVLYNRIIVSAGIIIGVLKKLIKFINGIFSLQIQQNMMVMYKIVKISNLYSQVFFTASFYMMVTSAGLLSF